MSLSIGSIFIMRSTSCRFETSLTPVFLPLMSAASVSRVSASMSHTNTFVQ